MLLHNRLIACVATCCSVDTPHLYGILFCACHVINYTTCVDYMLRINMVHANMHRYLVCLCCVTILCGILHVCEIIIGLYRKLLTTKYLTETQIFFLEYLLPNLAHSVFSSNPICHLTEWQFLYIYTDKL